MANSGTPQPMAGTPMIQRLLYSSQAELNSEYALCAKHLEKVKSHFSGTTEINTEFEYCDIKKCKDKDVFGFVPEKRI